MASPYPTGSHSIPKSQRSVGALAEISEPRSQNEAIRLSDHGYVEARGNSGNERCEEGVAMQPAMHDAAILPTKSEEGQDTPVEPPDVREAPKPPSPDRGDIR
jgi:hypothetical protein